MTVLTITPTGDVQFIWEDALQPMLELGQPVIRRASHVEPTANGQWTADLAPLGGPLLGPFPLRQSALDAEVAWLHEHIC